MLQKSFRFQRALSTFRKNQCFWKGLFLDEIDATEDELCDFYTKLESFGIDAMPAYDDPMRKMSVGDNMPGKSARVNLPDYTEADTCG